MHPNTLIHTSPGALLARTVERARARRVALGMTRAVAAERAGLSVDTLRRFETTGKIAFDRLVRLAVALNAEEGVDALFPAVVVETLEDPDRAQQRRVRGLRRDAGVRRGPTGSR